MPAPERTLTDDEVDTIQTKANRNLMSSIMTLSFAIGTSAFSWATERILTHQVNKPSLYETSLLLVLAGGINAYRRALEKNMIVTEFHKDGNIQQNK